MLAGRLQARRRQQDGESGQITILLVTFTAIALGIIMVAVDASLVFLGRQRLASAVDAAAVRAAQQFDAGGYFTGNCVRSIPLSQAAINGILAGYATDGIVLDAEPASVDGGPGVVVRGKLTVDLPNIPVIGVGSYDVSYETRARSSISGTPCPS